MGVQKIEFDKNRDIQVLQEKYKIDTKLTQFHLSFSFDKKESMWEFKGYRCTKCERIFKKKNTLEPHLTACSYTKYKPKYKLTDIDPEAMVLTKNGESWRPYEFNQKNS